MSRVEALAASILAGAQRVVAGYLELVPYLEGVLPTENDDLSNLSVIERITSIALLKRFEQLQDQTARLARAALELDLERVARMTVRDVANGMEKRNIVDDADDWADLNNLRNQLVHEYPIGDREQVERVNECWTAMPKLVAIHDRLRKYLLRQGIEA